MHLLTHLQLCRIKQPSLASYAVRRVDEYLQPTILSLLFKAILLCFLSDIFIS